MNSQVIFIHGIRSRLLTKFEKHTFVIFTNAVLNEIIANGLSNAS